MDNVCFKAKKVCRKCIFAQTVKKLKLWEKKAVEKSVWITSWVCHSTEWISLYKHSFDKKILVF